MFNARHKIMTSQIIITTVVSSLIMILALQLSELKSITIQYANEAFTAFTSMLFEEPINNDKRGEVGVGLCRMAQFGALILLRQLYTDVVRPIHLIMSRQSHLENLKQRYGSWGVIVGDLDIGEVALMREYAKEFIRKGMHILIVDCSNSHGIGERSKFKRNTIQNEVVQVFLEDLRIYARENSYKDDDSQGNSKTDSFDEDDTIVDIVGTNDGSLSNFSSIVTAKLGDIAQDGGVGILVHCFSSSQVMSNNEHDDDDEDSVKRFSAVSFLSVLNLTLPYMIFRGTGAIINVCLQNVSQKSTGEAAESRGVAECAFYTQLVRSIHYEYAEHSIDTITATIPKRRSFDPEIIVETSLQMLDGDSELDSTIILFKSLFKTYKTNND